MGSGSTWDYVTTTLAEERAALRMLLGQATTVQGGGLLAARQQSLLIEGVSRLEARLRVNDDVRVWMGSWREHWKRCVERENASIRRRRAPRPDAPSRDPRRE